MRCTRGAIWDVAVDLREGSPTRHRWHAVELTQENGLALFIPEGFAHGFQTLVDETEVLYAMSVAHVPDAGRGPALGRSRVRHRLARAAARRAHDVAARRVVSPREPVKRVLVTGAGGFIGRQTLAPLRERGFEVHAVGRAQGVDLLAPGAAAAAVAAARPTHLLHLAWYAEHGRFWTAPREPRVGGRQPRAAARVRGGGRAAGGGRGHVRGVRVGPRRALRRGTHAAAPATLYGAAKHGLHEVSARLRRRRPACRSPGAASSSASARTSPPGRLVPSVARALLAGREAPVTHGRQLRDFLAVEELGDAFAALLDSAVQGAVNVASGEPIALRELVELIAQATGRPELVRFGAVEPRPGEPAELVADVARLADEVGWRPREPLRAGVERAVAWWREQPAELALDG